jgi:hypothetical protein
MMTKAMVVAFLEKTFFVFTMAEVNASGIEMLSKIELLAKAALWQGYTILDGFVPDRNMNQKRLATPKRSKFLFLNLSLLHA